MTSPADYQIITIHQTGIIHLIDQACTARRLTRRSLNTIISLILN